MTEMTAPVTVSPESSIFAETTSRAVSGGALYLGGNPTAAMFLNQGQVNQWILPAAIVAGALLLLTLLRHR